MNNRHAFALALLVFLCGLPGGCSVGSDRVEREAECEPSVALLAEWLSGSFSSQAQSEMPESQYFDIRLEVVPIWNNRDDGPWLYVEQAAASALDRPYRQRVYHLTQPEPGVFRSAVFTLPGEPLDFAGAWQDPARFDTLSPADLDERDGCHIMMRYSGGAFIGSTEGTGCESTLRGASYATSEVVVEAARLTSWDQGWDAAGEQAWGAVDGPYIFDRTTD